MSYDVPGTVKRLFSPTWEVLMSKLKCPPTDLRGYSPRKGSRIEVQYAVSNSYNGGIGVGDEWYEGFEVPAPLLNPGHVIVGIGVGLDLNNHPPLATGILKLKSDLKEGQQYLDSDGVWKHND
jgi:hypothetical protein